MDTIELALLLIGAHYVADFAMQNQYVADAKTDPKRPDWFHALTAHAAHHAVAAGVALAVLGHPWVFGALYIGITHWIIDYGKSVRHWYGYHVDQALHLCVSLGLALGITRAYGI